MPAADDYMADLELLKDAATKAGGIAMRWFRRDPEVWMKKGDSPVSEADIAVDNYLKETLLVARPDYGWLSEETVDTDERLERKRVFVVDPIDGTRGFIAGQTRWCISMAVVEENRPVAAILECPALGQTITASAGGGAHHGSDRLSRADDETDGPIRVAGPKVFMSSAEKYFGSDFAAQPFVPSLAYRLGLVAMNEVDVSFARPNSHDWDLAAADLIVHEAGGRLTNLDGGKIAYNCNSTRHNVLVASAGIAHDDMLALAGKALVS